MIFYKQFKVKHLNQVIQLLDPLWGHLSYSERVNYLKWKYIENPCVNETKAYVALNEGNQVIGFIGYFELTYQIQNRKVNVLSYSDASVLESYRGKNVFKTLTSYSMKSLQSSNMLYLTTSNNSWTSTNTFIKSGSVVLGHKAILYKINFSYKTSKQQVELSNSFKSSAFINFYKRNIDHSKLTIDADESLWKWRYSNPISNYKFVYIWKEGVLMGFLSYYKINKFRAFILDFYFEDLNDFKDCLNIMRKKDNVFLTQMWSISKSKNELNSLKKIGFLSFSSLLRLLKKEAIPPALIRPGEINFSQSSWVINNTDVSDNLNWNINLICSDGI